MKENKRGTRPFFLKNAINDKEVGKGGTDEQFCSGLTDELSRGSCRPTVNSKTYGDRLEVMHAAVSVENTRSERLAFCTLCSASQRRTDDLGYFYFQQMEGQLNSIDSEFFLCFLKKTWRIEVRIAWRWLSCL